MVCFFIYTKIGKTERRGGISSLCIFPLHLPFASQLLKMSTDLKQEWYFGCCTQVQVPLNYKIWVNVYKCSHHRKLMGIGPQTKQAGYWSWAQYAYRLRICSLKKETFKLYIHYSITKLRGSTSIEKWINLLFWFAQALNQCIIMHYASLCRHKGRSWQILHHEEISWILWRLFRDRLMLCELCGEAPISRPKLVSPLKQRITDLLSYWAFQSCEDMEKMCAKNKKSSGQKAKKFTFTLNFVTGAIGAN